MAKFIWKFTNKRKLTASEFVRYFEKKILHTIRKYNMPMHVVSGKNLKANIINSIIKNLPVRKGKISTDSLDGISNNILYVMMYSDVKKLKKLLPKNQPLYFLSDKEILLYAKIKRIKGKITEDKKLEKINDFIKVIEQKNPDIRHNIVMGLAKAKI